MTTMDILQYIVAPILGFIMGWCFGFRGVLITTVVVAILFLLSDNANAEEQKVYQLTGVGVHVASHHWPSEQWNNVNPGVYVIGRYNKPGVFEGEYAVGTFYNSERKQSVYISRNFHVLSHIDVAVGGITGYRQSALLPLLAPSVFYDVAGDFARLRLTVLPKVATMPWVAHLSIERRF